MRCYKFRYMTRKGVRWASSLRKGVRWVSSLNKWGFTYHE